MRTCHKQRNKASFAVNGYFLSKNDNAVMWLVEGSRGVNHKSVIYGVMLSYNMNNYSKKTCLVANYFMIHS